MDGSVKSWRGRSHRGRCSGLESVTGGREARVLQGWGYGEENKPSGKTRLHSSTTTLGARAASSSTGQISLGSAEVIEWIA
jgi:hypothetical protein